MHAWMFDRVRVLVFLLLERSSLTKDWLENLKSKTIFQGCGSKGRVEIDEKKGLYIFHSFLSIGEDAAGDDCYYEELVVIERDSDSTQGGRPVSYQIWYKGRRCTIDSGYMTDSGQNTESKTESEQSFLRLSASFVGSIKEEVKPVRMKMGWGLRLFNEEGSVLVS